MSYVKLTCPSCKNKHEVSNFYLKNNNLVTSEELAKQLCNCNNFKETLDESVIKDYNKQVAVTEFGATSTPTFMIVNTDDGKAQRIVGAHPYSTFEDVINSLL